MEKLNEGKKRVGTSIEHRNTKEILHIQSVEKLTYPSALNASWLVYTLSDGTRWEEWALNEQWSPTREIKERDII